MARTVSPSTGKPTKSSKSESSKVKTSKAKAKAPKRPGRSGGKRVPAGIMIAGHAISALVDQVAADMRAGETVHTLPDLAIRLVTLPHALDHLFDLLVVEGGAAPRDEDRATAILLLVGTALGQLRMQAEADIEGGAPGIIMGVLDKLLAAAEDGDLPPDLILGVAQQFVLAGLPLPDEVRDLIVAAAREPMEGVPVPGPEDIAADFAAVAEALDHDPFLIHQQMAEQFAMFPDDARIVAIGIMAESDVPAMREAALGLLLDPNPEIARAAAERLAAAARKGLVSGVSAARLAAMRPWLPGEAQEAVGAAIAASRGQGGRLSLANEPAPARAVRFIASGCDGGGAQSLFALVRRVDEEADDHVFAALLMKHGHGLREAIVQDDLGPEGAAGFIGEVARNIDLFDTSPDFARDLIAHGLAAGLAAGEPPPFALLRFLDTVGLPPIVPKRLEPGAIVGQLLDGLPEERRSETATRAALAASETWAKAFHFPDSWFETDAAKITATTLTAGRKKQGAVLTRIVEPRRSHWGEQLAWIAKAVQGGAEIGGTAAGGAAPAKVGRGRRKVPAADAWIDLALVARALLGETPVEDIPLAVGIARQTIAAQRHW